ncbi:hypothetical protein MTO96_018060 [Rhipicephalus appendiculatus]
MRTTFAFQLFGPYVLRGLAFYKEEIKKKCGSIEATQLFFSRITRLVAMMTTRFRAEAHRPAFSDAAFLSKFLDNLNDSEAYLSTWTDQLLPDLEAVTTSIPTTEDHPAIDSRLAHLGAARTGLTNRWHKQRYNRRLHRGIAHLDRMIEQHTTLLARQQWEQLCSWLSGRLGCK